MIVLADLYMTGQAHVPLNTSLITIFSKVYRNEPLAYFGDDAHISTIARRLRLPSMSMHGLPIIPHPGLLHHARIPFDIINLFRLSRVVNRNPVPAIVILSVFPITRWFLLMLKKRLFGNRQLIVFYHDELEFLFRENQLVWPWRQAYWVAKFLDGRDAGILNVALGDSIAENLKRERPTARQRIVSLLHPYDFSTDADPSEPSRINGVKRFGIPGICNVEKNAQSIFEVASHLQRAHPEAEFVMVGRADGMKKYDNGLVDFEESTKLIASDEYERKMKGLDYALYFYPPHSYRLTASGALMDAIKYNKPVIALKNDFFKDVFGRAGDIGYLCEDLREMEDTIAAILTGQERPRYRGQLANLRKFREVHTYENLALELGARLREHGFLGE
jgi:hypothetical protein